MLDYLTVTAPITESKVEELKTVFKKVHFYNGGEGVPEEVVRQTEIWYTTWLGLPKSVTKLEQVPNTSVIQLSSAGANDCLKTEVFKNPEAQKQIKICSASGIHTLCIPQFVLANVLSLYMKLGLQRDLIRANNKWITGSFIQDTAKDQGWKYTGNRGLYGKTVGFLGYGHIARETARLFKAFHCRIIAANSNGTKRPSEGYSTEGHGDHDGSIPDAYYSTSDSSALKDFIGQCDILVGILPSTPQTRYLMTAELFAAMPKESIFVNVGRGDLAKSDDILDALDRPDGLLGAVLDVTDPEPLPDGHPLFLHPRVIVTPHTSGSVENYFDVGADVLIAQKKSVDAGNQLLNVVDPAKGY